MNPNQISIVGAKPGAKLPANWIPARGAEPVQSSKREGVYEAMRNEFPSLLQSAEDERRRKLNEDCAHEIGFNGFCAKCGEEQPCEEVDQ